MSLVLLEFSPIVVINNTSLDKLIPGSILLLLLFFDLALWFATMRSLIVRTRRESGR